MAKMLGIPALVLSIAGLVAVSGELHGVPTAKSHPSNEINKPVGFTIPEGMELDSTILGRIVPFFLQADVKGQNPQRLRPLPPEMIDTETLWLARVIFSESKRPEEQELIAWVVRNRVETRYRGKSSYKSVVLDPYQFSAFRRTDTKRKYYANLDLESKTPGWQRALGIAFYVRRATESERPFSLSTRHFFSERSMARQHTPGWASGSKPVELSPDYDVDSRRFRFFEGIS